MTLVRENVQQENWAYFNSLNIQFEGKHITADEYTTWVIDREREIIFTRVQTPGRDYGPSYILIWVNSRIYIYIESWSTLSGGYGQGEYHWDIKSITGPLSLENRRDELLELIREVADTNYDRRDAATFVIDSISEPHFVE